MDEEDGPTRPANKLAAEQGRLIQEWKSRKKETDELSAGFLAEQGDEFKKQAEVLHGIDDPGHQQEVAEVAASLLAQRTTTPGRVFAVDDRGIVSEAIDKVETHRREAAEALNALDGLTPHDAPRDYSELKRTHEDVATKQNESRSELAQPAEAKGDDKPAPTEERPTTPQERFAAEMAATRAEVDPDAGKDAIARQYNEESTKRQDADRRDASGESREADRASEGMVRSMSSRERLMAELAETGAEVTARERDADTGQRSPSAGRRMF